MSGNGCKGKQAKKKSKRNNFKNSPYGHKKKTMQSTEKNKSKRYGWEW